jgi:hypothetical protein
MWGCGEKEVICKPGREPSPNPDHTGLPAPRTVRKSISVGSSQTVYDILLWLPDDWDWHTFRE